MLAVPLLALLLISAPGGATPAPADTTWTTLAAKGRWGTVRLTPIRRIGQEPDATAFGRISATAPDPHGGVLVFDAKPATYSLVLLDSLGRVHANFGGKGEGPGEYRRGASIAMTSDGKPVTYETSSGRITVWSADGKLEKTLRAGAGVGGIANLGSLRLGPPGTVYIFQSVPFDGPSLGEALFTIRPRRAYVVDLRTGSTRVLAGQDPLPPSTVESPFGKQFFRIGLASGRIAGVSSDRLGFHLVAPDSSRVTGFTVDATPPAVVPGERRELEQLSDYMQQNFAATFRPPRWPVPNHKQIVTDAVSDHQGRIWLRLATEGVVGPPRMLAKTSGAEEFIGRYRDKVRYAGFLESGTFLGIVDFPDGLDRVVFSDHYAWGMMTDEDGLEYLVQFRLPG